MRVNGHCEYNTHYLQNQQHILTPLEYIATSTSTTNIHVELLEC